MINFVDGTMNNSFNDFLLEEVSNAEVEQKGDFGMETT